MKIILGALEAEQIVLLLPDKLNSNGDMHIDLSNSVRVLVSSGGWIGQWIPMKLLSEDLYNFLRKLLSCLKTLNGNASLASGLPDGAGINLSVKADGKGHFKFEGIVWNASEKATRMIFQIHTDQSCLAELESSIEVYLSHQTYR